MDKSDDKPHKAASEAGGLTFAVLGQPLQSQSDIDLQVQANSTAIGSVRKACATLKITSSIMNAIVVHPGADCDDDALAKTTRDLMLRAKVLADSVVKVLQVRTDTRNFGAYAVMLRQQAAEVVSTQWRMAHAANKKPLTEEQIIKLYETLVSDNAFDNLGEPVAAPSDLDIITVKRLALLSAAPDIHHAVNSFDYFHPNPEGLIKNAIDQVAKVSEEGLQKLLGPSVSEESAAVVAQSLIEKNGALYAANYRATARRDVAALQAMEPEERTRHLYVYQPLGLPTEHVDAGFRRLAARMIEMVCQAVPELAKAEPESAPASRSTPSETSAPYRGHNDIQQPN